MTDKIIQSKNYKTSPYTPDTEVIVCPINEYRVEQRLSVEEELRTNKLHLRLKCKVRFPRVLTRCSIEVVIWESDKPILGKDIDRDHVGIGMFQVLEKDEPCEQVYTHDHTIDPVLFRITVPETTENIKKLIELLLHAEGKSSLYTEIHAEVAGLLCEWNGQGKLSVTGLTLSVSKE